MSTMEEALTDRERQVIALIAQGLSNKEIARILKIADGTIKVHLHHIFTKLAVRNRTALALMVANGIAACEPISE
jgi:two-component system nitrate/nitrite response regulator NarL